MHISNLVANFTYLIYVGYLEAWFLLYVFCDVLHTCIMDKTRKLSYRKDNRTMRLM